LIGLTAFFLYSTLGLRHRVDGGHLLYVETNASGRLRHQLYVGSQGYETVPIGADALYCRGDAMTESPHTREISSALLLHFAPPLETRFVGQDAAQGVITGHASIFVGEPGGGPDSFGDVIARSAFKATIAAHTVAGTMPVMLWSHAPGKPVGRWISMEETQRGLFVRGQLNLQTQAGREAFEHLKARDVGGLSIGFRIAENGFKHQADGSRLLTAIDLFEISIVAMPAARAARVSKIPRVWAWNPIPVAWSDL
jgi:HK97 family phage prohead protease